MPKIIEDVENRILQAARQRLRQGDLSSFSARGIAEDCGIAVGTIYNYYRDKDSLMGAVMAQDWLRELQKADEALRRADSFPEGVLCLYGAIRRFSAAYEGIWQTYPTGEGFGPLYRGRHRLLLQQIMDQLDGLYARFGSPPGEGRRILLAELIIAASQHPEVGEAELLAFVSGAAGPVQEYKQ